MEMKPLTQVPSELELAILLNRLSESPEAQNILRRALFERDGLRVTVGGLQAKIDELMIEYCPEDMTTAQLDEYAKNQKVSDVEIPGLCRICLRHEWGPSHDGSKRCESGSIASGGNRSHCSCDICF